MSQPTRRRDGTGRPRLADGIPVVRRAGGQVQVGLRADAGLVFSPAGDELIRLLSGLDGSADLDLLSRRAGVDRARAGEIVDLLDQAGLLDGPDQDDVRRVKLIGCGRLGEQIARLLVADGIETLYLGDAPQGASRRSRAEAPSARSLAAALLGASDRGSGSRRPTRLVPISNWWRPDDLPPTLTVVALDTAEPDRLIPTGLLADGHPYLIVRGLPDGAVVGPLVVPGRTPCLNCCDLLTRDLDPGWPALLGQFTRTTVQPPASAAAFAAAVATLQAQAWLSGRPSEAEGATLEVRSWDGCGRWRMWPRHPDCPCQRVEPVPAARRGEDAGQNGGHG